MLGCDCRQATNILKALFILFKAIAYTIHDPYKVKGKAVPLQAWSGPEGSRELSFPDFLTTAQDGGKVVSLSRPVTGLEWPRGFQEVKVPRFLDNGTGWWLGCQP
jgi:hypothetical protein